MADRAWVEVGMRNNFDLPQQAPRWQRMWGARHLRWVYWMVKVEKLARRDVVNGQMPSLYNNWLLYAIGRGWL